MTFFKKIHGFFLLITALVVPIFFLAPQQVSADRCSTVTSAYFEPVTVSSPKIKDGVFVFDYSNSASPSIKAIIEAPLCINQRITIYIKEGNTLLTAIDALEDQEYIVPASGRVELTFKPSEEWCTLVSSDYNCQYRILVDNNGSTVYDSSEDVSVGITKGHLLKYNCSGLSCLDGAWKMILKNALLVSNSCIIEDASWWSLLGPTPLQLTNSENAGLELGVNYKGCIGWKLEIRLTDESSGNNVLGGVFTTSFLDPSKTNVRLPFLAGERECKGRPSQTDCIIRTTIIPLNEAEEGTAFKVKNTLNYNCKTTKTCDQALFWTINSASDALGDILKKNLVGFTYFNKDCKVISTAFDPYTKKDEYKDYSITLGETRAWFWEEKRDIVNKVTATITTKDCSGSNILVSVFGSVPSDVNASSHDIFVLQGRSFLVPEAETFSIALIAGEEGCGGGAGGADCKFKIKTTTRDSTDKEVIRLSDNDTYGHLNYKCDTICEPDVRWKYAGDTSAKPYPSDPLEKEEPVVLESDNSGAISPECIGADGKAIDGCYTFYKGFADVLKGRFDDIDSIGGFLNALIALAIGFAGIIAVGMIMWDGFTYWKAGKEGNENDIGKVKGRIWKRLLGLILLLTIYTLLRTINPDLLNLTPRINLALLDSGEQGDGGEDAIVDSDVNKDFSKATQKACAAGFEKVYGFITCKSISEKLTAMLDSAKKDSIALGGGGFRTLTEQLNLRRKNCGGSDEFSLYKKAAKECSPPTAIPGTSRHEQGLAFDFTCNGKGIINVQKRPETAVCFEWLKKNASTYGLKNLPVENWHWSIDGR